MGYAVLAQALSSILADQSTADTTFGFILSLSLHDFSFSTFFTKLQNAQDLDEVESRISQFGVAQGLETGNTLTVVTRERDTPRSSLGRIREPGALQMLWDLAHQNTIATYPLRFAVCNLLERLSRMCHRNHVFLCGLQLVGPLFETFYPEKDNPNTVHEKERYMGVRLLRRLLEMSSHSALTRKIFRRAVNEDGTLNQDILELIRSGMKSRWPEHFSLESPGAFVMTEENSKGMSATGFTFMVCVINFIKLGCFIKLGYTDFASRLGY